MDRQKEIALALSACPPSVATKAAVYVLDKSGYVKVRDSQNGFTAIVQHALPTSQEPQCMDAEGTRSHLPRKLTVAGSADGYSCDTCTRFWEACQTNADIVCTRSTSTHPGRQGRKSRCANYILSQRSRVPSLRMVLRTRNSRRGHSGHGRVTMWTQCGSAAKAD